MCRRRACLPRWSGAPLLIALLLKPLRLVPAEVEAAMGTALLALALLGVAFTFLAARRGGASLGKALAAAALLGLCSPWLVYAKSYFAGETCGVVLALGLWALAAERPTLAALCAALAAAMKPQYAAVCAGWVAHELVRQRWRPAARMVGCLRSVPPRC